MSRRQTSINTNNKLQLDIPLHPNQIRILHDSSRFRIAACGRRWGKTHIAWVWLLTFMLEHPKCLVWWVAPYYQELIPASRKVRDITPPHIITKKLEQQTVIRYIQLINGAECWFRSADKEDTLRGSGLHALVVDEAGAMRKSRWDNELRPSLSDYKGPVMFISTPKGHNWFYQYYTRGADPLFKDYKSWNFPSIDNPFLDKQEILDAKKDLPELVYRQEYGAEFIEDIGAVFRQVRSHIHQYPMGVQRGHRYVIGADLAKYEDYTVLIAIDELNGQVMGFDRFQQLDWVFQQQRIVNFTKRFNGARLCIDSTGIGDPIYDHLSRAGIHIDGYKFTRASKANLIENLSVMMDRSAVSYPDLPVLINELQLFGYETMPSGVVRYRAPSNYHDDCVIALALAAWMLHEPEGFVIKL